MRHAWPIGMRVHWIEGKRDGRVIEQIKMSHDLPGYRVRFDKLYRGLRFGTIYESALRALSSKSSS